MNARSFIDKSMQESVGSEPLNLNYDYEMNYYSSSRIATISVTARSAVCFCRLTKRNLILYMMGCCSKVIYDGCDVANQRRVKQARLVQSCPFCRKPTPKTQEEAFIQSTRRMKANDPVALSQQGAVYLKKGTVFVHSGV